jgi:hypothetical protein
MLTRRDLVRSEFMMSSTNSTFICIQDFCEASWCLECVKRLTVEHLSTALESPAPLQCLSSVTRLSSAFRRFLMFL